MNNNATCKINDVAIYFETYGNPNKQPMLILHGFTGSSSGLGDIFAQLLDKYYLIIPDLRGHGRSTNPSGTFTFKQAAEDMYGLLDFLGLNQFDTIGFSGGGCALLHMATQQPYRVKAMALVSAAPYFPEQTKQIMRQLSIKDKTEEEWQYMRLLHHFGNEQISLLWQQSKDFAENNEDLNFTSEKLTAISAKTLIVQGDRDPLYPLSLTIEMHQNIKDSFLWIIPNSGHVPINNANSNLLIDYIKQLF